MDEARNFTFTVAIRLLLLKLPGQGSEQACNSIFDSDNAARRAKNPTSYSQPFRSAFGKIQNIETQGFQFPRALFQCGDLMRDRDVGKVRIDDLYALIIIRSYTLKLKIKVVQTGDDKPVEGRGGRR